MCNKVLPIMRKQQKGLIINIGSVAGVISIPFQSMYSASKFALEAFSEALRIEVKPFGVNVCIVEPGDTKTEFSKRRQFTLNSKSSDSNYKERFKKSIEVMETYEKNGTEPTKWHKEF